MNGLREVMGVMAELSSQRQSRPCKGTAKRYKVLPRGPVELLHEEMLQEIRLLRCIADVPAHVGRDNCGCFTAYTVLIDYN